MGSLDKFQGFIPTSTPVQKWAITLGEVGNRVMLGPSGRLVVGDKSKKLTVLNTADGSVVWQTTLNYPFYYGSPTMDGAGNTYAAAWQELSSFDATGARRWRVSFSGACMAPLQVGDSNDLYLVTAPVISGTVSALNCYDTATGALRWSVTLPGNAAAQSAPALLGQGVALVATDNGDVFFIAGGAVQNQVNVGGSVRANLTVYRDNTGYPTQLIVASRDLSSSDPSTHKITCLNLDSSPFSQRWSFCPKTNAGCSEYLGNLTSPVMSAGGVVFAGFNGHLWGIVGGAERFRCAAANLAGPIAMDGQGNVIVSRERGDLVAVDLNGNALWTLALGGQGAGVAIDGNGDFYFGSKAGTVYGYTAAT